MHFDVFEQQQPQKVWLLREGVEIEIPLVNIKHNDILVVQAGDNVPVDGSVTEGMASIDQHALTGESRPGAELALPPPKYHPTDALTHSNRCCTPGRLYILLHGEV